jgi:hypothetical protein
MGGRPLALRRWMEAQPVFSRYEPRLRDRKAVHQLNTCVHCGMAGLHRVSCTGRGEK